MLSLSHIIIIAIAIAAAQPGRRELRAQSRPVSPFVRSLKLGQNFPSNHGVRAIDSIFVARRPED